MYLVCDEDVKIGSRKRLRLYGYGCNRENYARNILVIGHDRCMIRLQ